MKSDVPFLLDVTAGASTPVASALLQAPGQSTIAVRASRGGTWRRTTSLATRGWLGRIFDRSLVPGMALRAVIEPGLFSAEVGRALPALFAAAADAPRIALLRDPRVLHAPETAAAAIIARMPAYLHELTAFDFVLAASTDERDALLEFWRWAGIGSRATTLVMPPNAIVSCLLALPAR